MVGIQRKLIEHAIDFSANCGATRSAGDQSHFADHGMTAETAHTYDAVTLLANKNADATLKDEMHGVGRFALPGDVMARPPLLPVAYNVAPAGPRTPRCRVRSSAILPAIDLRCRRADAP